MESKALNENAYTTDTDDTLDMCSIMIKIGHLSYFIFSASHAFITLLDGCKHIQMLDNKQTTSKSINRQFSFNHNY